MSCMAFIGLPTAWMMLSEWIVQLLSLPAGEWGYCVWRRSSWSVSWWARDHGWSCGECSAMFGRCGLLSMVACGWSTVGRLFVGRPNLSVVDKLPGVEGHHLWVGERGDTGTVLLWRNILICSCGAGPVATYEVVQGSCVPPTWGWMPAPVSVCFGSHRICPCWEGVAPWHFLSCD